MTTYKVKRIEFLGRSGVPTFLQNVNGPCPLLSIANVLSLRNQLGQDVVAPHATEVHTDRLLAVVADRILSASVGSSGQQHEANLRANIHDCLEVLNKLSTGVDVNVRFNSPTGFEFTNEIAIFDLLGISLVHGWLVDPQAAETARVLGGKTYNQAVEMMIAGLDPDQAKLSGQPSAQFPFAQASAPAPQPPPPPPPAPPAAAADGAAEVDLLGLGGDVTVAAAGPPPASAVVVPQASTHQDLIDVLDSLVVGCSVPVPDTMPDAARKADIGLENAATTPVSAAVAGAEQGQSGAVSNPALAVAAADVGHAASVAAIDGAVAPSPDEAGVSSELSAGTAGIAQEPAVTAAAPAPDDGMLGAAQEQPAGSEGAASAAAAGATAAPSAAAVLTAESADPPALVAAGADAAGAADAAAGAGTACAAHIPTAVAAHGGDDLVQLFEGLDVVNDDVPPPLQPTSSFAADQPSAAAAVAEELSSMPVVLRATAQPAGAMQGMPGLVASHPSCSTPLVHAKSQTRRSHEALVVREFLESHASQLTVYGITQIAAALGENALAVFFRNNHFNCLFKHGRSLYLLVTDQGYLGVPEVAWERLDTVDGDTQLCGCDFKPYKAPVANSQPTHINMEALASIPPEALAGMSEADAAAVAEAAGLLVPQAEVPAQQAGTPQRVSQQGGYHPPPPPSQQQYYGQAAAGHHVDADLALALQLQQEEEEAAARQHAHQQQRQRQQQWVQQQQQQHQGGYGQGQRAGQPGGPGAASSQQQRQQQQQQQPPRAAAPGRPPIANAPPKKEESSCVLM